MLRKLNRRDALIHLGLGTAGWLCLPRGARTAGEIELAGLSDLAARVPNGTGAGLRRGDAAASGALERAGVA